MAAKRRYTSYVEQFKSFAVINKHLFYMESITFFVFKWKSIFGLFVMFCWSIICPWWDPPPPPPPPPKKKKKKKKTTPVWYLNYSCIVQYVPVSTLCYYMQHAQGIHIRWCDDNSFSLDMYAHVLLMTSLWSKCGTAITRARDEKHRLCNTVMSVAMSKSISTNFIQKSSLLNIVNRHAGVIAQSWTANIKIQPARLVCGIHDYFVSVQLSKVRVSQNPKTFSKDASRARPVTWRVASQCECKGASAWVRPHCAIWNLRLG